MNLLNVGHVSSAQCWTMGITLVGAACFFIIYDEIVAGISGATPGPKMIDKAKLVDIISLIGAKKASAVLHRHAGSVPFRRELPKTTPELSQALDGSSFLGYVHFGSRANHGKMSAIPSTPSSFALSMIQPFAKEVKPWRSHGGSPPMSSLKPSDGGLVVAGFDRFLHPCRARRAVACEARAASWSGVASSVPGTWLGDTAFVTTLGASGLGARLVEQCLAIERRDPGRFSSNKGGWQSKDLVGNRNPVFSEFVDLLHEPVKDFLFHARAGRLPKGVAEGDVHILVFTSALWANVNRCGHSNSKHGHGKPGETLVASGIYYPVVDSSAAAPVRFFPEGSDTWDVVPDTDMLILFPNDLQHAVLPVESNGAERISVAFNVEIRWLDKPMLHAAAEGDTVRCQDLASKDASCLEAADGVLGFRPLHLAAEAGHLSVVKVLAGLGAQTDAVSQKGVSLLIIAATKDNPEMMQFVIDNSQSRMDKAVLQRALSVASTRGHARVMDVLLSDADLRGVDLLEPCALAAQKGHASIVTTLFEAGADPQGAPFGHMAAATGHLPVVASLVAGRANFQSKINGLLPVDIAAARGDSSMVEMLQNASASKTES